MSKLEQVLIYSIQPEHVLNFLNGRKIDEIRKRDLPQWAKEALAQGEVVEGYGYCTKGAYLNRHTRYNSDFTIKKITYSIETLKTIHTINGKVVFKFQVSGVSRFDYDKRINHYTYGNMQVDNMTEFLKNVCITENDIWNYGSNSGFKPLYAHHFTNIQPIEPMEIDIFISDSKSYNECPFAMSLAEEYMTSEEILINRGGKILTKAPQSFQTVWVKEEMK